MFQVKALFFRALLALSLIGAVPAALAGPTYQVKIDANADARSLDLQFLRNGSAPAAFAYISNLNGDFGNIIADNAFGSVATGFTIGNEDGFNGLLFELLSVGPISFDVSFSGGEMGDGTTFSIALLDALDMEIGGKLFTVSLMPGVPDMVQVAEDGGIGVAAVPEPGDWLLVGTGLFLIGALRRKQQG